MRKLLPLLIFLLILGAPAVLFLPLTGRDRVGPGPGPGIDEPPAGEITIAYPEEPMSFNPYTFEGDSTATRDLLRPVLPTLLSISPELRYGLSLAAEMPEASDAGGVFTVTVKLDPDAKWSDGMPITSEDVKFTWQTIANSEPALRRRSAYRRIVDVQTPDPTTLTMVFDSPYPLWRNLFSAGDFILPKHALEGRNFADEWRGSGAISGGPFVMTSVTPGLEVVYEPNPHWWGRGPGLAWVRVVFVPSLDTAIELMKQGRVQVISSSSEPNITARLSAIDGVTVDSEFGASWWELGWNTSRIGDPSHRRAIATGIDRTGIVEAVVRGEGRAINHVPPTGNLGDPFAAYRFDTERSKRERGQADLGRLVLSAPSDSSMALVMEQAIQAGLKNADIEAEFQNPDAKKFYGEWLRQGSWDMSLWERRGTPLDSWRDRFHSGEVVPAGENYTRISDGDLDALLARTERTALVERQARLDALEKLADLLPILPMFEGKAYLASISELSGPVPNATIEGPFWNLELWQLR